MTGWYYAENGERFGPVDEQHLAEMLKSEQLDREALVWKKGMGEWVPAITVPEFSFLEDLPPPFIDGPPQPTGSPHPEGPSSKAMDSLQALWSVSLVLYLLSSVLNVLVGLIEMEDPDFAEYLYLWLFPLAVVLIIILSIFHYKCWNFLPEKYRETTPGKAVGYLFIPIFNFYWAFVTWPGLVRGLKQWKGLEGSSAKELENFAIAYAVMFVCYWTIGFIPGVSILVTIGDAVVFVLLYRGILRALKK